MSCCDEMCMNHGCNQGDDCPVRKAAAEPVEPTPSFDPIPPFTRKERIVCALALSGFGILTVIWVAGLAGFLYARHKGA